MHGRPTFALAVALALATTASADVRAQAHPPDPARANTTAAPAHAAGAAHERLGMLRKRERELLAPQLARGPIAFIEFAREHRAARR